MGPYCKDFRVSQAHMAHPVVRACQGRPVPREFPEPSEDFQASRDRREFRVRQVQPDCPGCPEFRECRAGSKEYLEFRVCPVCRVHRVDYPELPGFREPPGRQAGPGRRLVCPEPSRGSQPSSLPWWRRRIECSF